MTTSRPDPGRATAAPSRAVWVWDEPAPEGLAAWCAAKGVGDLFLAVPTDLTTSPRLAWLREVRRQLPDHVGVQLLGGDPGWLDEPGEARRWWTSAVRAGPVAALHLDLEVWAHSGWDTDLRPALVRRFLALLAEVRGLGVPVEVDLAHHLHQVRTDSGQPLDRAVLGLSDAVTLLTYRRRVSGSNGLLEIARPTLAAAVARRTPVRLAVACSPIADDPTGEQGFHGRTEEEMLAAVVQVEQAMGQRPGWRGMAMHDRAGWAALG